MDRQFQINNTADLEVKMVERMNDMVKALTRSSADRHETKKNFRVIDKQLKNLYEIMMFQLNPQASGDKIPSLILNELTKYNMSQSMSILNNHMKEV